MRRFLAITAIISLLFSLTACDKIFRDFTQSSGDTQQDPNTGENTTAQTLPIPKQLPMTAISLPVVSQSYKADNGKEIYHHSYQNIRLIVADPEVADKVIIDFLNRTDMQNTVDTLYESAKKDQEEPGFLPYYSQVSYTPGRIDGSILSLYGGYTEFTGWFHPNTHCAAVTYDLITGQPLSLQDIITENTETDTVVKLLNAELSKQKEKLMGGFETIVQDIFSKGYSQVSNWYLSNEGLCFIFSPYEIGPYASGTITAQIPYGKLNGILKDPYFPGEKDAFSGNLIAEKFQEDQLGSFTQIAELVLDENGDKIFLHTDGAVYDLRIESGTWSADGQSFNPSHTVFASYALTPGDGIMVQAALGSNLPTLRLTYRSGSETIQQFISLTNNGAALQ